jgi:uracil-DNA glycosylase
LNLKGIKNNMSEEWEKHLTTEMQKDYFVKLRAFVKEEQRTKDILPPNNLIFNAFEQCPYWDLKVVIIGKEPYSQKGLDHGLAYSIQSGSSDALFNILKEVRKDIFEQWETTRTVIHKTSNLTQWAKQGMLLLNSVLTVEKDRPESHKNKGWEEFTINTIKYINHHPNRVVFMLWGKFVEQFKEHIDQSRHLVLSASHPSSYTAQQGFIGCHHFSQSDKFILKNYFNKRMPILWHLE